MACFPLTYTTHRPHFGYALFAAWLLLWKMPAAAASQPRVELFTPQAQSYVMGDLIEHSAVVTLPKGYVLDSGLLPKPGALSDWLDLQRIAWEKTEQGEENRYRLRLSYRVFKGVRGAEQQTIPPLPLRFRGAGGIVEAQTPEWGFVLNPIIPAATPDRQVTLRDSLPPPAIVLDAPRWRLAALLAGVLAVLIHLARHYQILSLLFKPKAPFARARQQLRKLARRRSDPEAYRQAFRALHRALDETAGQTLLAGHLPRFCRYHPAFAELSGELEQFFAGSQRLFFAVPEAAQLADYPFERLEVLCQQCELLEKSEVSLG